MDLAQRLLEVEARIRASCEGAGRERADVTLIAVTKTVPVPTIQEAYDLGLRDFGESRLQEAIPKIEALPNDIRWHFIGTLQSNKARKVATLFPTIHTICNQRQLAEIDRAGVAVKGFVEINIAREDQKSGIFPEELDAFLEILLQSRCTQFSGLMTIGPAEATIEERRSQFAQLRELSQRVGGRSLSMGMSADYELAIQEGSTHVRVGSLLFGERTS